MVSLSQESGFVHADFEDGSRRTWGLAIDRPENSVSVFSDRGEYATFTFVRWNEDPIACLRSMQSGLEFVEK